MKRSFQYLLILVVLISGFSSVLAGDNCNTVLVETENVRITSCSDDIVNVKVDRLSFDLDVRQYLNPNEADEEGVEPTYRPITHAVVYGNNQFTLIAQDHGVINSGWQVNNGQLAATHTEYVETAYMLEMQSLSANTICILTTEKAPSNVTKPQIYLSIDTFGQGKLDDGRHACNNLAVFFTTEEGLDRFNAYWGSPLATGNNDTQ